MCAGTYHDREFRDHVLRDIYSARARRIAPSRGFDLVPVLRHAWRAWWLETGQHLLTVAALACWLVTRPLDTLIALNLLVIACVLRRQLSWLGQYTGYGSQPDPGAGRSEQVRERNLRLRRVALAKALRLSLGALVVLGLISVITQGGRLTASSWAAGTGLTVAAILATLIAVPVAVSAVRARCAARLRSAGAGARGRLTRRMRGIDLQQRHPFSVHSGSEPFLGSGKNMRSWSFAQRLVRAAPVGGEPGPEYQNPPFTATELVDRLRERIDELRHDVNPETRLWGLSVDDCVFVEGTRAARVSAALAAAPKSSTVLSAIADVIKESGAEARHYLCAQVVSWAGEIVTSVFVHVSLQGRTLYLEFATYALFPVRPEYAAGNAQGTGAGGAGAVLAAIADLPAHLLETRRLADAPFTLWAAVRAGRDPKPAAGPRGDIGAEFSVRESAMIEPPAKPGEESESSYFQFQDIAQHSKIIERRLIAAVEDFLVESGVDRSEFVRRTSAILNNGIMNTGNGTVNVENSAVGENSKVLVGGE